MEFARTLLPGALMRSMSTVQTTVSRHFLPSPPSRCFKVCTRSRMQRRGLVASSLEELLEQAARVFLLSCHLLTLVLEEDGTVVDSEDFFQSLPDNMPLMVLEKGEMWTQNKTSVSFRPRRNSIAKLTFDLYKLHPRDFLCCLAVKATLYEVYTLFYDFRCGRINHVLRSVLCHFISLTRLAGQLLLCTSSSLLQLTGEDDC
ncbi:cell death activator CIDE-A isoform X2 [Parambassis ranga]|uniref:Cell death activator CIDE-A isoform X2 n=1 Tax=Parambassis ranga TaxID=210632 RepID=A0A6P7KKV8_9TELE|nr:cell death activator CIDE-A-like isoform X2 [Parambassis ranga]